MINTTNVPANGLVTLQAKFTRPGNRTCVQQWSFHPKDKHSYVLSVRTTEAGCSSAILNATNPEHLIPEPSAVLRNSSRQACMPLAEAQAAQRSKLDAEHTNDFPPVDIRSAGPVAATPDKKSMDDFKDLLGDK
ncbi:MAG: hypothetical protein ACM31P_15215 [Actinomycetota bacterium]